MIKKIPLKFVFILFVLTAFIIALFASITNENEEDDCCFEEVEEGQF